jgi:uncharacterized protein (TIGR00730 family)
MRICVFCGSLAGCRSDYRTAAQLAGATIARRGAGLVYGGGHVGLMGVVADAALAAGGEVIGVIPAGLAERELAHPGLTRLHVVNSMHERKALMADLSDGFLALPGGFGTLDELFEIVTWAQLGLHAKPIGLLNAAGYFGQLLAFINHQVNEEFVSPANLGLIHVSDDVAGLISALMARWHTPSTIVAPVSR